MSINRKSILILFFILSVGICTGAFFEVFMKGDGKAQLIEMLSTFFDSESTQGFSTAFLSCIKSWIVILAIMFFSPVFPPLGVLCPVLVVGKGLTLGFSATMLVEAFGVKGGWYILSTMVPHALIQLPVLCVLAASSVEFCLIRLGQFSRMKRRSFNKNALQVHARQYLSTYGFSLLLIVISCLLEAFLN